MNKPSGLECLAPARARVAQLLLNTLAALPGLCSATIVGSFADGRDLSTISDIDVVAVFDRLTPSCFDAAVAAVSALKPSDLGLPAAQLRLNTTLGPLKYDDADTVVVHLMSYDRTSHREHVLKSPFTCLDWERSPVVCGARLADIYPVCSVSVADVTAARRGLMEYIDDLQSATLSFRRFEPIGDRMVEVRDRLDLDARHQGEFAYHIVRNLVANVLKLLTGENRFRDEESFRGAWERHLPQLAGWIPMYQEFHRIKLARGRDYPVDTLSSVRSFLVAFSEIWSRLREESLKVVFVRHARTPLSDGTFLGRRRDPRIDTTAGISSMEGPWDFVHSSPLLRAIETARAIAPESRVATDDRLAEIDYGEAEGLDSTAVRARWPAIAAAWNRGEDPPFPGGEATEDVRRRLHAYLSELLAASGRGLVVTHNVVMRILAADLLGIPPQCAYRLPIPHLQPLAICRIGGRWLPEWSSDVKARLVDGYVGWTGHDG